METGRPHANLKRLRGLGEELRRDFARPALASTVSGGLIAGVVTTGFAIAYAALIFRDELAPNLPVGTGLLLASTLVVGVISALWSSMRGLMAGSQDATSALLGIAAVALAAEVALPDVVSSVVALVAVTSISTGVVLYLLGRFHFGGLARYLPYTLVGGFMAATGVVIFQGCWSLLDADVAKANDVSTLWAVWVPAFVVAGGFLLLQRLRRMTLTFPVGMVGAGVLLHVAFLLAGFSKSESVARGWLLGAGEQVAWSPELISDALGADWGAVFSQIGAIATVTVFAAVAVLLHSHSLELALHHDFDLDRELMVAGVGNVAAGAVGGAPGYASVADTVLLSRLGAPRRGAALVAAAVIAGALITGPSLLPLIPRAVVGGLLLYVGSEVVIDWVWGARDRLTVVDQG